MKFNFTCEQQENGPHITNVEPNDTLQMPLPCKVQTINGKEINTCEEFHKAYKDAAEGDHRFFILIMYNGKGTYFNLHITEQDEFYRFIT